MRSRAIGRLLFGIGALGVVSTTAAPLRAQTSDQAVVKAAEESEEEVGAFGLNVSISDGTGLNRVGQNYRNDLSLLFSPTWKIGRQVFRGSETWKKLVLSGRFMTSRALAGTDPSSFSSVSSGPVVPCSNPTPRDGGRIDPGDIKRCNPEPGSRRLDYSDVTLAASLPRFATVTPLGLALSATARVTLPISAQSRFQTLRLGVGGTGSVSRTVWGDRLRLGYSLGASKNFHEYTTAGLDDPQGFRARETGSNPNSGLAGVGISNLYADPTRVGASGFNVSYSFSNSVNADLSLAERWSLDATYSWTDGFTYGHECVANVSGYVVDTCDSGDAVASNSGSKLRRRGHRKGQVFSVTASYALRDWMDLSLAWSTWAPRLKPDSSFRQGFISTDYNAFTTIFLSTTISVEELAARWTKRRRSL